MQIAQRCNGCYVPDPFWGYRSRSNVQGIQLMGLLSKESSHRSMWTRFSTRSLLLKPASPTTTHSMGLKACCSKSRVTRSGSIKYLKASSTSGTGSKQANGVQMNGKPQRPPGGCQTGNFRKPQRERKQPELCCSLRCRQAASDMKVKVSLFTFPHVKDLSTGAPCSKHTA